MKLELFGPVWERRVQSGCNKGPRRYKVIYRLNRLRSRSYQGSLFPDTLERRADKYSVSVSFLSPLFTPQHTPMFSFFRTLRGARES